MSNFSPPTPVMFKRACGLLESRRIAATPSCLKKSFRSRAAAAKFAKGEAGIGTPFGGKRACSGGATTANGGFFLGRGRHMGPLVWQSAAFQLPRHIS